MSAKIHGLLVASVAALVLLAAPAGHIAADSGARTYDYLIGAGPLCALDPTACPVIARAQVNDDMIEIGGTGTFTIHPKSVTGGGVFTHKDAAGNVLGTGSWTAEDLLSFHGYGTSPGLPSTFEGGKVVMRVHLMASAFSSDAIMQVDCLIGNPPAGAMEGIRLALPGGLNFNKEVSGFTLYIRIP